MSNINGLAGFRSIGAGLLPNGTQSLSSIPGLVPGGLPATPGVVPGDRQVPQELTPPADPAVTAPKEPIFLGPIAQRPFGLNITQNIFDVQIPLTWADYSKEAAKNDPYNPFLIPTVVVPPPSDNRGGITYLLDNLDKNPIAVAITGFVLGTIGGLAPGVTGAVVSTTIGVIDVVTNPAFLIKSGTPTMSAERIQKVTVNSTPTGLTVGGIPNIGMWNTTAYTTYKRIPLTASLINNTITIRGFTMDFENTGLAETGQIDINIPTACTDEFFYAPNADDTLVGEDNYYQMWGIDSAGVTQTALAKVKMLSSGLPFPVGYRDTVNIEIANFPATVAPSGSLYLPTITINYITRLDTTYVQDFLGMRNTF